MSAKKETAVVKGFKGFNKDLKCTPKAGVEFQYEVGKSYTHDGERGLP